MGTYRTKPEEVEAIQYTGSTTKPFDETVPDWVWGAFSYGTLKFTGLGINIEYNGLSENVMPGDWLVVGSDKIIRACDNKVFQQYYTSFRIRRTKAEVEAMRAEAEAARIAAETAAAEESNSASAFPEGSAAEAA
jgi:hypothetical protein